MEEKNNLRPPAADGGEWKDFVRFEGRGGGYFGILFVNFLLSLLTLGIYSFWGRTRARKYLWSGTHVMGEPLEYTGTGKELFISFLIVLPGVLIVTFLLSFLAQMQPLLMLLSYPLLLFGWEFASYRALRYRLTRTRWRGIRGNMSGSALSYAGKACLYWLAVLCSLGLLTPWASARMANLKLNNVWFGNRKAHFDGPAKELFKAFFLCYGLSIGLLAIMVVSCAGLVHLFDDPAGGLTLEHSAMSFTPFIMMLALFLVFGLYYSFYQAAYFRWLCGHIAFGGLRLRSTLSGWQLCRLLLGNVLLMIFTLGLAWAWVLVRSLRLRLHSVLYAGDPALEELLQDTQKAPARGEGLLEALDVDIAL